MATKPVLPTISNTGNVSSQIAVINSGFRTIEDELEKMVSREAGSLPNEMFDDFDANGNKVINIADGTAGADAVNRGQLDTKEDGLGNPADDGYVLASMMDGTRFWVRAESVGSGGATLWGGIGGMIANQVDLQSALNSKLGISSPAAAVTDTRTSTGKFIWTGTEAQYDALTPDANTIYLQTL